jgi:multidrug efflux pump subunit AcrA (membrane-fusion protein)
MWIYVDETDVGQVRQGMVVEYSVDSLPGKVFTGSVDQIYPEPEVRDNIVYVRALVKIDADTAAFLRPEMTTQCRIVVEVKENVLSLPNIALKWVDGAQVVYVRQADGSWRTSQPKLGLQGAERSEVLAGVSEGDVVATRLVVSTTATMPGNMR